MAKDQPSAASPSCDMQGRAHTVTAVFDSPLGVAHGLDTSQAESRHILDPARTSNRVKTERVRPGLPGALPAAARFRHRSLSSPPPCHLRPHAGMLPWCAPTLETVPGLFAQCNSLIPHTLSCNESRGPGIFIQSNQAVPNPLQRVAEQQDRAFHPNCSPASRFG